MLTLSVAMMFDFAMAAAQAQQPTPASQPAAHLATGFLYRQFELDGQTYGYTVFVPPDYRPDKRWPVILFLHGSGERGDDGFLPTAIGIANAIRRNVRLCPAIVVIPQCRAGRTWDGPMLKMALHCLTQTAGAYSLDPERFYITGLSLGGAGTWQLGAMLADQVAAIAPVCGFVDQPRQPPSDERVLALANRLRDVPVWCFHGDADHNVLVDHSRRMVESLRARGGNVRYTEYPGAGHAIWDRVYQDPMFWEWLLAQRRPQPQPKSQPTSQP